MVCFAQQRTRGGKHESGSAAGLARRSDVGMLPRQSVHDREYRMAWPAATQENQSQKIATDAPITALSQSPKPFARRFDLWRARCPNPDGSALMFPGMQARARKTLATPIHPDNWLRLY